MTRARVAVAALATAALATLAGCSKDVDPSSLTPAQEQVLAQYVKHDAPAGIHPLDVELGGKVHLVGYEVSPAKPPYRPGTQVKVTLWWRVDQKLDAGWKVFTHLTNREGQAVDNLDNAGPLRRMQGVAGQPLGPSRWKPGSYYEDELTFTVPTSGSPELSLGVGIYRGKERMPITKGAADKGQRATVLRFATGEEDLRAKVPAIDVPKLEPGESITIDGKLDEPAWQKAAIAGPFVNVGNGHYEPRAPVQGTARLRWDDGHLYAGFEIKDAKVRGGWPEGAKDPHLWEKDTVEIMTDPDGDGDNKDYYEIQVNPQNLVFDTQYDDYNRPNGNGKGPFGHEEWSAGLTSKVVVHGTIDDDSDQDEGYTVEIAIPWASFAKAKKAPPAPGDTWRMNFYAMQNNGGTAWSPILGMGNFHRASRFGRVRWVGGASAGAGSTAPAAASAPSAAAGSAPATGPSGATPH